MTRDYKAPPIPQRSPRRRGGGSGSGFFWFVTGAVVGAFGVGLAWMLDARTDPATAAAQAAPPSRPAPAAAAAKPRFDFYDILPELEVVVPDDELAGAARPKPAMPPAQPPKPTEPAPPAGPVEKPQATASAPASGESYLLQVASFRAASDADRLKAELALQGIQVQVQQVTINGKDTYHRVRAGPYKGKEAANQARARLTGKGLEPIAIKLK